MLRDSIKVFSWLFYWKGGGASHWPTCALSTKWYNELVGEKQSRKTKNTQAKSELSENYFVRQKVDRNAEFWGKLCCINTLKCKGINIIYNCYTVLLCILIFVIKFLLKVYHRFSYGGEMH